MRNLVNEKTTQLDILLRIPEKLTVPICPQLWAPAPHAASIFQLVNFNPYPLPVTTSCSAQLTPYPPFRVIREGQPSGPPFQ